MDKNKLGYNVNLVFDWTDNSHNTLKVSLNELSGEELSAFTISKDDFDYDGDDSLPSISDREEFSKRAHVLFIEGVKNLTSNVNLDSEYGAFYQDTLNIISLSEAWEHDWLGDHENYEPLAYEVSQLFYDESFSKSVQESRRFRRSLRGRNLRENNYKSSHKKFIASTFAGLNQEDDGPIAYVSKPEPFTSRLDDVLVPSVSTQVDKDYDGEADWAGYIYDSQADQDYYFRVYYNVRKEPITDDGLMDYTSDSRGVLDFDDFGTFEFDRSDTWEDLGAAIVHKIWRK